MSTQPLPAGALQVDPEHYEFGSYLSPERWASYWHQVAEVAAGRPKDALYVGVGDDIVPSLLEKQGIAVRRFDFDARLQPDYAGDVRDIGRLVPARSVDVVACCQVLEHLPFEHFEPTLRALCGVARRRVVVSLPYCHRTLASLRLKLPKVPLVDVALRLPRFWKRWTFDGEHHWEIGVRGHSRRQVERIVRRVSPRFRSFHVPGNPYHLFFVIDLPEGGAGA